jgi:hypothetical protein
MHLLCKRIHAGFCEWTNAFVRAPRNKSLMQIFFRGNTLAAAASDLGYFLRARAHEVARPTSEIPDDITLEIDIALGRMLASAKLRSAKRCASRCTSSRSARYGKWRRTFAAPADIERVAATE